VVLRAHTRRRKAAIAPGSKSESQSTEAIQLDVQQMGTQQASEAICQLRRAGRSVPQQTVRELMERCSVNGDWRSLLRILDHSGKLRADAPPKALLVRARTLIAQGKVHMRSLELGIQACVAGKEPAHGSALFDVALGHCASPLTSPMPTYAGMHALHAAGAWRRMLSILELLEQRQELDSAQGWQYFALTAGACARSMRFDEIRRLLAAEMLQLHPMVDVVRRKVVVRALLECTSSNSVMRVLDARAEAVQAAAAVAADMGGSGCSLVNAHESAVAPTHVEANGANGSARSDRARAPLHRVELDNVELSAAMAAVASVGDWSTFNDFLAHAEERKMRLVAPSLQTSMFLLRDVNRPDLILRVFNMSTALGFVKPASELSEIASGSEALSCVLAEDCRVASGRNYCVLSPSLGLTRGVDSAPDTASGPSLLRDPAQNTAKTTFSDRAAFSEDAEARALHAAFSLSAQHACSPLEMASSSDWSLRSEVRFVNWWWPMSNLRTVLSATRLRREWRTASRVLRAMHSLSKQTARPQRHQKVNECDYLKGMTACLSDGSWEALCEVGALLSDAASVGAAGAKVHGAALQALVRQGRRADAWALCRRAAETNVALGTIELNIGLGAAARCGEIDGALQLLKGMRSGAVSARADVGSYDALFAPLMSAHRHRDVLALFADMRASGLSPLEPHFRLAISAAVALRKDDTAVAAARHAHRAERFSRDDRVQQGGQLPDDHRHFRGAAV